MFQKLYKYLEEINRNTQRAPNDPLIQAEWVEKICGRLDLINDKLSLQKKHPLSRPLIITGVILSCLGVIGVGITILNAFQLSRVNRTTMERAEATSRALDVANSNYQELNQKQQDAEAQRRRMDSLVQQQSQTINELKKLNEVTVRAFIRMKKEMDDRAMQYLSGRNSISK